jgi:NAD(P)-dependent dehydrogenase (short-subunit alcohol dehydrogenase family)
VNLRGVTLGLENFLPLMRAHREGGRICATSSMGGLVVADDGGIYSAAKFGVVALMEGLRVELAAENIGVSVLCPAAVNTNIHDHETMRPREFSDTGLSLDPEHQRTIAQMARSILAQGADPLEVGERVVQAMLANEPYVFTDGRVASILQARREALLAAAH